MKCDTDAIRDIVTDIRSTSPELRAVERRLARFPVQIIMRRFCQKHNPSKLENGNFLANVMTLTDDEIRSRCHSSATTSRRGEPLLSSPTRRDYAYQFRLRRG